jgi:DNA-binding response OmpR family regulator
MERTPCILVVDDEIYITELLERILEGEGYDVTIANNGQTALVAVDNEVPDLAILDINMPGINGYEVLERIRKRHDIPVIMLTAILEASAVDKSIGLGADDYIRKPFRSRELVARVKAKLRRAGFK